MRARRTNWLGNHSVAPKSIVEPRGADEVIQALAAARRRNERVRVVGAGAGWSPLLPTDGCLLSMKRMAGIRHVDASRQRITVEPGALLSDVVEAAASHGLSVKSPSMYLGLSVGGLIATGSHGTGRNAATFGDAVTGFELVTAEGDVHTVTEPGSELWRAVITNLGALGVLTSVTLQCEPIYNVHEIHHRVPSPEAAALIPVMLRDYEFVSVFWYPSSAWTLFKVGNRTALPAESVEDRINPSLSARAMSWLGSFVPSITARAPFLNTLVAGHLLASVGGTGSRVVREPCFSHYQQAYPPVISSEFAIPAPRAAEAWSWLHGRLTQFWKAGVRPVNLLVHARFGRASEALIASSSGRATCHVEVLSFDENPSRALFEGEFDEKMRGAFDGRPHWGKDIANPWRAAETHGENMDRFLSVREELDPEQRFLNTFLRDDVFGLGRRRRAPPLGAVPLAAPPPPIRAPFGELAGRPATNHAGSANGYEV